MAYPAEALPRFRVNVFRQRGHISFAFRAIPKNVPNFASSDSRPASSASRTSTAASCSSPARPARARRRRSRRYRPHQPHAQAAHRHDRGPDRDPAQDHACIVNQREIGLDTADFYQALRRALRQDPDVILVGELRDAETAQTAIAAPESGHLVLSTMHTVDAAETIGRMIEFFPGNKQQQIRTILAGVLRGVVSQRCCPARGGRVAAVEVMVTNTRIADLIRENKVEEISDAIGEGAFFQMQTFAAALIDLVVRGGRPATSPPTRRRTATTSSSPRVRAQARAAQDRRTPNEERGAARTAAADAVSPRRADAFRTAQGRRLSASSCLRRRPRDDGRHGPRGRATVLGFSVTSGAGSARVSVSRARRPRTSRLGGGRSRFPSGGAAAVSLSRRSSSVWQGAGAAYGSRGRCSPRSTRSSRTSGERGPELRRRRRLDAVHALDVGRWGVDANGDGVADPWNARTRSSRRRAISPPRAARRHPRRVFSYNHAHWYVDEVLGLARVFGDGGIHDRPPGPAPT